MKLKPMQAGVTVGAMAVDADKLRAISEHVLYEGQMVAGIGPALNAGQFGEDHGDVIRNALVEAFAVHARGLSDFLFRAPRQDDAAAEQFFAPGEWAALRGEEISPQLRAVRERTNKEIAHLTYSRLNVPEASSLGCSSRSCSNCSGCSSGSSSRSIRSSSPTTSRSERTPSGSALGSPPGAAGLTRAPAVRSRRQGSDRQRTRTARAVSYVGSRSRLPTNSAAMPEERRIRRASRFASARSNCARARSTSTLRAFRRW